MGVAQEDADAEMDADLNNVLHLVPANHDQRPDSKQQGYTSGSAHEHPHTRRTWLQRTMIPCTTDSGAAQASAHAPHLVPADHELGLGVAKEAGHVGAREGQACHAQREQHRDGHRQVVPARKVVAGPDWAHALRACGQGCARVWEVRAHACRELRGCKDAYGGRGDPRAACLRSGVCACGMRLACAQFQFACVGCGLDAHGVHRPVILASERFRGWHMR